MYWIYCIYVSWTYIGYIYVYITYIYILDVHIYWFSDSITNVNMTFKGKVETYTYSELNSGSFVSLTIRQCPINVTLDLPEWNN